MSNVPKSRRKIGEDSLVVQNKYDELRKEVTNLIINDFGFSINKYRKKNKRYFETHDNITNAEEMINIQKIREESFDGWFINLEAETILNLMHEIQKYISFANGMYPSNTPAKIFEFVIRKMYFSKAIGLCHSLKREIYYIINALPVDLNKYIRFDGMITEIINMLKGLRAASNRFYKDNTDSDYLKTYNNGILSIIDGISSITRSITTLISNSNNIDNNNTE